jgi:hypothetical protein
LVSAAHHNPEEYSMSFRRFTSTLLALAAVSIGGSHPAAQVSSRGTSLLVPITGVADLGGMFSGALLIERFVAQANNIAVVGTVTGALTTNATIRNLVLQVTLPLDLNASRASLNTDAALAQASCDVLHVELGSASINVLGSTIGFNPLAFDLASTAQTASPPAAVSTSTITSPTVPPATAAQTGTVTASPSTNTTQPGAVAKPAPAAQQTATPATLGALLCSVDRFRDVSNPARLTQQLNAILTALSATEGS